MQARSIVAAAALAALTGSGTVSGGAFDVVPQGGRAAGLAGAFTAQADDASAVYYNPGGLAFVEQKLAGGLSLYGINEALYQGLSPGPGAGTNGEQDAAEVPAPHVYYTQPLSKRLKLGVGVYSPFLMSTEWRVPESFAGRFVSVESEVRTYDLTAALSLRLTPRLGLGAGLVYRNSELTWRRHRQIVFNGQRLDVASVDVTTDTEADLGWNVGILHRTSDKLSWGAAYRSAIPADYLGVGKLTQIETGNTQIDNLIAATLPLDQDLLIRSRLKFPATLSLGVAFKPSPKWLFELDLESTDWSRVREVAVSFETEPDQDASVPLFFDDTTTTRFGVQYSTRTGSSFRLGVAFDESPQPDATVGPFFVDANRTLLSVGFGRDWLDVALTWIDSAQRIVTNQVDDVNGNYRGNAFVFTFTASKKTLKALKDKKPPEPPKIP